MDNKKIEKQINDNAEIYIKNPISKWHRLIQSRSLFFKKYFKKILIIIMLLAQFVLFFLLILKIKNCLPKICYYNLLIFFLKGEFFSLIATFLLLSLLYIHSFWYEDFFK